MVASGWGALVSSVSVGELWQQGDAVFVFATTQYVEPRRATGL